MINEERLKEEHQGKWLAIHDDTLIASHESFHQLHILVEKMGIRGNLRVIRAPGEEDKRYGLML